MTRNTIRWMTLTASAFPFVASFSGCHEKHPAQQAAAPEVEVVAIDQKDVPIYREFVGTLAGDDNANISAQVTGYLLSRNYTEGSAVTNGQVLFQIDPGPFQAALNQAKAQVAQATAQRDKYALDVKRYTPLAATEAISQQDLDDAIQNEKTAQANVEADEAAAQKAALNLGFATVRSPLDGVGGLASVTRAQIGNLIGPSTGVLTTVEKVDPMRVYFSVAQELVTQIQRRRLATGKSIIGAGGGPELELTLAGGYVYPAKGHVRFADNQVDVKTGTVTVVGEFPNPDRLLVAGMFVRVRVLVDTAKNALLVPQRALSDLQGGHLIAVVGPDNKISIRPVKTGEQVGQQWIIVGEVKAGDRVVAEGVQKVHDGTVVNPVPFVEKAAASKEEGTQQ